MCVVYEKEEEGVKDETMGEATSTRYVEKERKVG